MSARRGALLALLAWLALAMGAARPAEARIGLVAGPQWGTLGAYGGPGFSQPDGWVPGGFGGVRCEFAGRPTLAFVTGIEYSVVGLREQVREYGWNAQGTAYAYFFGLRRETRVHRIELPLRVEWRPHGWRVGGGPVVGLVHRVWVRDDYTGAILHPLGAVTARPRAVPDAAIFEVVGNGDSWRDETSSFEGFTLDAQAVLGRELAWGRHVAFAELSGSLGLTDLTKGGYGIRTRGVRLAFGGLW